MKLISTTLAALSLCTVAAAQETYWIASRTSGTLDEIDACGNVRQTITMGTSLRSAHVAPDGRIWVVRFGSSTVDVLAADGTPLATPTHPFGSAYDIAFDAAGHAWVSGGSGVAEFDALGNPGQSVALSTGAPLGITVDADGNKWVAHRIGPPGFVSRIDGTTGAVTVHPLNPASQILPTRVYADFRGIGMSSHIWVIGDNRGSGQLTEFDAAGNELNTYTIDAGGNFGGMVADIDPASTTVSNIYLSDFRNGNIWRVDAATGAATSFPGPTDALGVNIGGFGNLWVTTRSSTAVWRMDAATGTFEIAAPAGTGVQSALSTRWDYATVVDPLGDLDGDNTPNVFEVVGGSSPFDPCSTPSVSLSVEGPTGIGTSTALLVAGTGTTTLAFGTARAAAPIAVPGVNCTWGIDPTTVLPASVPVAAGTSVPFVIPNDAGLVGLTLFVQGVNVSGIAVAFSNLSCFTVY